MAASSAVTNTGLTGLRRNVLNKWVEYLSCTVSELGLKNPQTGILGPGRNEPHTLQGVHPSERQCSTLSVFVQSLHPHHSAADAESPRRPNTQLQHTL